RGGIDYIKDDHGLADQSYSPFAARLEAVGAALRDVGRRDGASARYVPSLSGDLDAMRAQIALASAAGVDAVGVAPMVGGLPNFHAVVREHAAVAFFAHPAMGGAARIAPPLLIGKLFRLLGADAVIFPNHGGRFGYSPNTCRELARAALEERDGLRPCVPVAAGGLSTDRVPEMLDFYGADVMLLIGGGLLAAGRCSRRAGGCARRPRPSWPRSASMTADEADEDSHGEAHHPSQGPNSSQGPRLPLGGRGRASLQGG